MESIIKDDLGQRIAANASMKKMPVAHRDWNVETVGAFLNAAQSAPTGASCFCTQNTLLLRFLMLSLSTAPLAVFLEINLAFDELTILTRPVVDAGTLGARELDELVL